MTNLLASWFQKNNIHLMLFDLDDTFIETNRLFLKRFDACREIILKHNPKLEAQWVEETISATNIESFKVMGGNLDKRWPYVANSLATRLSITNNAVHNDILVTLQSLYQEIPSLKPGAREALNTLSLTGVPLGLVTHANVEWTYFKLEKLELKPYFKQVFIIDENAFKTHQSWLDAMNAFQVKPVNTAIIGDSLRSDILPGFKAGAGKLFWIHEDSGWSFYHQGKAPPGTIEVNGIANLIPLLR